jgi:hypothetical protein
MEGTMFSSMHIPSHSPSQEGSQAKKQRWRPSPKQKASLDHVFARCIMPDTPTTAQLACVLGLTVQQVRLRASSAAHARRARAPRSRHHA